MPSERRARAAEAIRIIGSALGARHRSSYPERVRGLVFPGGCQPLAGWTSPVSQAQPAISTRLRTPSLLWMLARWDLTVLREMNRSAAISVLVRPLAMAW